MEDRWIVAVWRVGCEVNEVWSTQLAGKWDHGDIMTYKRALVVFVGSSPPSAIALHSFKAAAAMTQIGLTVSLET